MIFTEQDFNIESPMNKHLKRKIFRLEKNFLPIIINFLGAFFSSDKFFDTLYKLSVAVVSQLIQGYTNPKHTSVNSERKTHAERGHARVLSLT